MVDEELTDFYEELNEAPSEKAAVISVMVYAMGVTTLPLMIIMLIYMLAPTTVIGTIGALAAALVWVLVYHFYNRMIRDAVAAKKFLYTDTVINRSIYEEQLCIIKAETIIEPLTRFELDELQRDTEYVDATVAMVKGMDIGEVRAREEHA